jgi:outer membrane lipoprotein carrier protein
VASSVMRAIGLLLVCGLACALAEPSATVRAQASDSDSGARAVAASVQTFYDQTRDVSASFFQTFVNKLYKRTDRSKGQVVFKKPGMMRWEYAEPSGKVIVSNGKKLLVYEPGEDGDKGQVLAQEIGEAQLPQALAFLMGSGKLADSFTFRLLDAKHEGYAGGDVLELRPKKPTPHYDRILFYVERAPTLRGLVRRLLIIDGAGNRNRFDFSTLKFNSGVPTKYFDWQPPRDARRVQM